MKDCSDCGDALSAFEERYFEHRCEVCEQLWHERLQEWRRGKPDAMLDAIWADLKAERVVTH